MRSRRRLHASAFWVLTPRQVTRPGWQHFGQGCAISVWLEGTNLLIEYRWAEGNYERLPGLADQLVQLKVDVLVTHATPASLAAKSARARAGIKPQAARRKYHRVVIFYSGVYGKAPRIIERS